MKKIDDIVDKIKDPVVLKKVIDTILDPKNPDSNKIRKEVIKNITNCIQKDTAFLTIVKGIIIENADNVTETVVKNVINEYREQLTNALVTTINLQCQEYFNEQKKIVHNLIKKALNDSIKDIETETKKLTDKHSQRLEKKSKDKLMSDSVSLEMPSMYKEEMEKYLKYLRMCR
jgi:predicted MPP superfamily phosphohydrolase